MRLLRLDEHGKPAFTRDFAEHETPPYAILSHTWGDDDEEVIYQDICGGNYAIYSAKPGFAKVRFCGEQARKDGLEYFWVDSCCINKHNSTELAEAINSMFRWYKNSSKCYAFLADVSGHKRNADGIPSWEHAFRNSRWFKRGWTLQELLAPKIVEFFARDGSLLGSKTSLEDLIYAATRIPREVLRGCSLSDYPPKARLAWAAGRETKKREDKVYCLLGIFEVTLHIAYGISYDDLLRDLNHKIKEKWDPLDLEALRPGHCRPVAIGTASEQAENSQHRKELMESLEFDQMDARQASIKSAQRMTCDWLLQHQIYISWQDFKHRPSGSEILWIKGKPGVGKSTLMKHVLAHARKIKSRNDIIVHFFFNARGDDLEKTVIGMYRFLLLQLLQQAPDLQYVLDACSPRIIWTTDALQGLLAAAIESLGARHLKCFIDALDECDEQDIRDMILFFEDVAEGLREEDSCLSLCFASRHYPTISVRDGWQLILEDETGHDEDLSKYIKTHLRAARGVQKDELREQLRTKANGVFIWAVLVVDILNVEIDAGRGYAVSKRLQQIPPKLGDLFKEILLRDQQRLQSLLLCMQWILFAKRPLTREEFYIAVAIEDEDWDAQPVEPEAMTCFVLNSSKGLAELTKSQKPTVQFIHESVRDFLKDGGLREIWPLSSKTGSVLSQSHDQLKQCCHRYLELVLDHVQNDQRLPWAKSDEAKKLRDDTTKRYPFLDYACHNVFYHADEAARAIAQSAFVDKFPRVKWIHATNILQQHDTRRHGQETGFAYVFAENNLARLLRSTQSQSYWQVSSSTSYRLPVIAAFSGGHRDSLQTIIEPTGFTRLDEIVRDPSFGKALALPKLESVLPWAGRTNNWALLEILVSSLTDSQALSAVLGSNPWKARMDTIHVLRAAAKAGRAGLMYQLLDVCRNLHSNDDLQGFRSAALCAAAEGGQRASVQRLLDDGVSVNAQDWWYEKPVLCFAASRGRGSVVRLLIDAGADIEAKDRHGSPAVSEAAKDGHEAVVRLLIDAGADIEAKDRYGETALSWASRNGHEAVVRDLIDSGADIDAKDRYGETALYWASRNGHEAFVRLLIESGANVHIRDRDGDTALFAAARQGHEAVVRLLVEDIPSLFDTEIGTKQLTHALHAAVWNGRAGIVWLLIENGADVDAVDDGDPAMYEVAKGEWLKFNRLLRNRGVNSRDCEDYHGEVSVCYREQGFKAAIQQLVSLGYKKEDLLCELHNTPLVNAAEQGHEEVARLLLERGADVHITNKAGETALDIATSKGHEAIVRLLVDYGARDRSQRQDM